MRVRKLETERQRGRETERQRDRDAEYNNRVEAGFETEAYAEAIWLQHADSDYNRWVGR